MLRRKDVTDWKKLITSFKSLQGEYAQEFVHLVEREARTFRTNDRQQNLYFAKEQQRATQEIERRRIKFEEKHFHCNQPKLTILNTWEWNNHVLMTCKE